MRAVADEARPDRGLIPQIHESGILKNFFLKRNDMYQGRISRSLSGRGNVAVVTKSGMPSLAGKKAEPILHLY